jgi:GT2 family glycosyltransferase
VTEATTVVVASRDRREVLMRTLAALREMPEQPAVIVIDDASSDGTSDAVRDRCPSARIVSLAASAGAAARNIGVRLAMTALVAFADDDSSYRDGSLTEAARIFHSRPLLGLLAARVLVGPEETLDPTCRAMETGPLRGFLACGAIVRRDAFLSAGGFHPWMAVGGEEDLLAYRLAAAGWDLEYRPEVTVLHKPPHRIDQAQRQRALARNAALTDLIVRSPRQALVAGARRMIHQPSPSVMAGTVEGIAAGMWLSSSNH